MCGPDVTFPPPSPEFESTDDCFGLLISGEYLVELVTCVFEPVGPEVRFGLPD